MLASCSCLITTFGIYSDTSQSRILPSLENSGQSSYQDQTDALLHEPVQYLLLQSKCCTNAAIQDSSTLLPKYKMVFSLVNFSCFTDTRQPTRGPATQWNQPWGYRKATFLILAWAAAHTRMLHRHDHSLCCTAQPGPPWKQAIPPLFQWLHQCLHDAKGSGSLMSCHHLRTLSTPLTALRREHTSFRGTLTKRIGSKHIQNIQS